METLSVCQKVVYRQLTLHPQPHVYSLTELHGEKHEFKPILNISVQTIQPRLEDAASNSLFITGLQDKGRRQGGDGGGGGGGGVNT